MKLAPLLLIYVAALVVIPTVSAEERKREPKPRFKGVELYSWKDDKGDWHFALLNGTNEEKTVQRVKVGPTVYKGTDKLISELKLLAEGEQVSWSHRIVGFEYPPKDGLKKIDEAAKAAKIKLNRP